MKNTTANKSIATNGAYGSYVSAGLVLIGSSSGLTNNFEQVQNIDISL